MTRAELIAMASPPCHECREPVQRVEIGWRVKGHAPVWIAHMVCGNGHRVLVEPIT